MNRRVLGIAIAAMVLAASVAYFVLGRLRNATVPSASPATSAPRAPEPAPAVPDTALPANPPDASPRAPRAPRRGAAPPSDATATSPTVAAPELGTLRFEADVPNAQVFLDRRFIGIAPLTAEGVKPGTHQINASAEGHEAISRTIDVEPGPRDVRIRFREVRLNATLAVIHKHRMGSCRGQLVATPQGLRYDTEDKDDRFTTSLNDLETFAVDYLDKNLKIKLRKGKQYNFTDPDGNADRLFVFQRDVDKARQRLVKGDTPASN